MKPKFSDLIAIIEELAASKDQQLGKILQSALTKTIQTFVAAFAEERLPPRYI